MTKSFVATTERFAEEHQIPLIPFEKGQRKETFIRRPSLADPVPDLLTLPH
jgi:hypothetical protein